MEVWVLDTYFAQLQQALMVYQPNLDPNEVEREWRPLFALTTKLQKPRGKQSTATYLKKTLKLNPAELALLREAGPLPEDPAAIASRIKTLPITCIAPYDIDRAISSAGGIALEELGSDLMLKKLPGVFAAGEMLDWEAPTGGYLLQACFATGRRAADGICDYLDAGSERKDT